MRLLTWNDDNELSLTKDLPDDKVPPYATLSHTWAEDDEEVTFVDLQNGLNQFQSKAGYKKIQFCGRQARRDGIEYFWVDTCCIDKTNSSELTEAIISMYRWYHNARKCYVYLTDVSLSSDACEEKREWKSCFKKSRWFTRGWTLQELLAPREVEFYSHEETYLGTKETLAQEIYQITKISLAALRGAPLSQFPIVERWCWADQRKTRRKEDEAYCLLGIFDVFMPPLYGEGNHALYRLEKELRSRFNAGSTTCYYHHDAPTPISAYMSSFHSPRRPGGKAESTSIFKCTSSDQGPSLNCTICTNLRHMNCDDEMIQYSSNGNKQQKAQSTAPAGFGPSLVGKSVLSLAADIQKEAQRSTTIGDHKREESIREQASATVSSPSRPQTPVIARRHLSQLSPSDDRQYRIFFVHKQESDWTQASFLEQTMSEDEIKNRIRYGPRRSRQQKQNIKWTLERIEAKRRSTIDYLLQVVNHNSADSQHWKIVAVDDERVRIRSQNSTVNFFSIILAKVVVGAMLG